MKAFWFWFIKPIAQFLGGLVVVVFIGGVLWAVDRWRARRNP